MAVSGRGVYTLLLSLPAPQTLPIGRLGAFRFPAGYYLYVGSALGPGGLSARLARHCRAEKKRHWHIDHLRAAARLEGAWALTTDRRAECRWAAAAQVLPGANLPAPRFGASDCRCPAHLFHYPVRPEAANFAAAAGVPLPKLQILGCDGNGT
jgi:Uri superfamily endonuclease